MPQLRDTHVSETWEAGRGGEGVWVRRRWAQSARFLQGEGRHCFSTGRHTEKIHSNNIPKQNNFAPCRHR